MHGPLSFAIPSAVRGYALAVERFGRLPWRELVAPAVPLAQGRPAGRLVHHGQGRQRRRRSAALPREPAGLAAGRSAAGLPARERRHDPAVSGVSPRPWSGSPRPGPRISIEARSRDRSPPMRKPRAGCCRPRIWPAAGRGSCAPLDIPYRGVTFQTAPGMTAGPTLAGILAGARPSGASPARPTQIISTALVDALRARLCRAPRQHGRRRGGLADLDDPHHRGRSSRRHRRADDDIAVVLRQPLRAARDRHPDEQRRHVVRPAAGPAEFDRARQARADQYVPGRRRARRAAVVRRRRIRRPAHPRRGAAAGELCRRFRHGSRKPRPTIRGSTSTAATGLASTAGFPPKSSSGCRDSPARRSSSTRYFPTRFACPNLVLRGADGLNHGISDVMSPWSAAVAEPDRD